MKILIVEDDALLAFVNKKHIEKLGHEAISCVKNGEDAIAFVQHTSIDLILMDIKLNSALDGIDTMDKIREIKQIPVIYLTGSSEKKMFEKASVGGFVAFLIKPINSNELKQALAIIE